MAAIKARRRVKAKIERESTGILKNNFRRQGVWLEALEAARKLAERKR
jgi:hypothetical protein